MSAILLAKKLRIFGMAYGTVLESLYGLEERNSGNTLKPRITKTGGICSNNPTTNFFSHWRYKWAGIEIICSKSAIGVLNLIVERHPNRVIFVGNAENKRSVPL